MRLKKFFVIIFTLAAVHLFGKPRNLFGPTIGPPYNVPYGYSGGWYYQYSVGLVYVDCRGTDASGRYWVYE